MRPQLVSSSSGALERPDGINGRSGREGKATGLQVVRRPPPAFSFPLQRDAEELLPEEQPPRVDLLFSMSWSRQLDRERDGARNAANPDHESAPAAGSGDTYLLKSDYAGLRRVEKGPDAKIPEQNCQ